MNPDSGRPITVAPSPPKMKREKSERLVKRINIGPCTIARLPRDKTQTSLRMKK